MWFLLAAVLTMPTAEARCYERFLVPLSIDTRAGANGSRWQAELLLHNRSDETLMFNDDLVGVYAYVHGPTLFEIPPTSWDAPVLANTYRVNDYASVVPAAIFGVDCTRRHDVEASVHVDELDAAAFLPVQLPVVSEHDTFRTAIALHAVPMTNPGSRTTLRVYDLDVHATLVRVSLEVGGLILWNETHLLERPEVGVTEFQPSYAELLVPSALEPLAGRLEIESLDGAEHRLWAMASVTSADSRDVRVILPAGGSKTWREECEGAATRRP